jgi:Tfp pilus assembly protein PilN
MVPTIDFLPASYHVQRQREHKTLWRRMMVSFFLALAVLGTWQQRQIRRKLETRRDELQAKAAGLVQAVPQRSKLDQELQDLETKSQVLTTLQLRVPLTRVLAAVTQSLPELVSLSECHAESGSMETASTAPLVMTPAPLTKEKAPPFNADLTELRNAASRSAMMLTLSGIAPDDLAISSYLVALRETKLFERVTLAFTGQHQVREENWRQFQIRLQVRNPEAWLEKAVPADQRVVQSSGGTSR